MKRFELWLAQWFCAHLGNVIYKQTVKGSDSADIHCPDCDKWLDWEFWGSNYN